MVVKKEIKEKKKQPKRKIVRLVRSHLSVLVVKVILYCSMWELDSSMSILQLDSKIAQNTEIALKPISKLSVKELLVCFASFIRLSNVSTTVNLT